MSEQLAVLKRAAESASPGPWRGDRIDGTVKYHLNDANGEPVISGDNGYNGYGIVGENDEHYLMTAHPAAILSLIAEVEAARRAPAAAPAPVAASDELPVVARLYTQNGYRRAAISPGPGKALVLKSDAERAIARAALAAPPAPAAAPIVQPVADELRNALAALLKRYGDLAGSGDAGNWDWEAEEVVVAARAALAAPTSRTADAKDAALKECREFLGDMHCMPVDWTIKQSTVLLGKVDAAIASSAGEVKP